MTDVIVYENRPCRRCGVTIRAGRCKCQSRREPLPPKPARAFAAYQRKAPG